MSSPAPTTAAPPLTVALIGNPNTGKSTLFNALAGMNARVGNYPGVTVEKKLGRSQVDGRPITLIDLPGTYSLSPRSLDEMVSVDVLLGRQPEVPHIDAVVCITDASNLERHLYLASQLMDTGLPVVLVLNMWDMALRHGITIHVDRLREKLGIPVVVTEANHRRGIDDVRRAILETTARADSERPQIFPEAFTAACERLQEQLSEQGVHETPLYLIERLLLDAGGTVEREFVTRTSPELLESLSTARQQLREAGWPVPFVEVQSRYRWAKSVLSDVVEHPPTRKQSLTDRIDRVITHHVAGLFVFAGIMFLIFQAIYHWAGPLMEMCEAGQGWVGGVIAGAMAPGPFRSLLIDGVVAGVGGVLIFLPQIMLLFLFIAILEDCGYMARAAYMMDRLMSKVGLSGKSFLPLMSSFACAVPGVMATRVIDNPRDRMITILIAPLMSCSARLPVYLLLIAAFIPATAYVGGWLSLQGLVLFGMMALGAVVAIPVAWLLKKTFFRGEASAFVMELPEYQTPSARLVAYRVYDRGKAFVVRAGTLIFATTILVWAAGYFPADHSRQHNLEAQIEALEAQESDAEADAAALSQLRAEHVAESSQLIRQSFLGRSGQAIEPAVKPLGWDWRIGVGVLASFPAREVIIATLGTIYSLGGDVDEESEGLMDAMRNSTWPDGSPVYNVPVALSVMVFFALCAQCASTLMIIRRETNSWRWPVFSFVYMTVLAYVGALITYQVGMAMMS
jgi:ferrous iron transport protein B